MRAAFGAIWSMSPGGRPGPAQDGAGGLVVSQRKLLPALRQARPARVLVPGRAISASVPDGANHYGMEFGAANVAIHAVSAAVELADGTLAVTRAERARARNCAPS
jgi:hypothetical protein